MNAHFFRTLAKSAIATSLLTLLTASPLQAQVPQLINYQGRVTVGTTNFDGVGQFKFALVNTTGTTTYWSNDNSSVAGSQPLAAVQQTVTKGLYAVLLGDTTLGNMTDIPSGVFSNTDVRLRVWFNDGTSGSQLLTPDQRIAAVGYAMMAANVPDGAITTGKLADGAVGTAQLADGAVSSAKISPGAAVANLNASGQSGVAKDGLVLSANENPALVAAGYVKIGLMQTEDHWEELSNGTVPSPRAGHTATWTGSEMIVWGGGVSLNDGGRYNPVTNRWTTIQNIGAPGGRSNHSAIWTGAEVIIWGGVGAAPLADGGRYDPVSDSWAPVTSAGAPTARAYHTAVWTGVEMLVWGGSNAGFVNYSDGGRYSIITHAWTAMSNIGAPSLRHSHTATWTGSEMLIWGGVGTVSLNDGKRYKPSNDTWTALPSAGAPSARQGHTAVWTGTELLIWGGTNGNALNDGGQFNPVANTWTSTASLGAPASRFGHTAVWTGSEMIIWGGMNFFTSTTYNDGGKYSPASRTWTSLNTSSAPAAATSHSAIWTGSEMIVWGGSLADGTASSGCGRYDPMANSWTGMINAPPSPRSGNTALWTGSEMIIWGGSNDDGYPQQGGRYNPVTNHWSPTTTIGAPLVRDKYTAVWTGTEMIVWGGSQAQGPGNTPYNDGKRYNPATDSWSPVSLAGAPSARKSHTAIWTGTEMIVWGGWDGTQYSNNGGRYNPSTNSWLAIPSAAVSGRYDHTAIWTGTSMVIWGGSGSGGVLGDGWSYEPGGLNYVLQTDQAPSARTAHRAIWTGTEMIIWAGLDASSAGGQASDGSRWNGRSGQWKRLPTFNAPTSLAKPNVFWTGTEMLIADTYRPTSENIHAPGALFNPATETWSPMTHKLPPPRYLTPAVWTGHSMLIFSGVSPYLYRFPDVSGNPYHSDVWEYTPGKTFFLYQKL